MKIVFWSPVHGQTANTSNTLAITLIAGMLFRKKAVLTQTHFKFNNLESPLIEANSDNRSFKQFFREIGVDSLIRNFKAAKIDMDTLERCSIALENTNILLLPGSSKTIQETFEFDMKLLMPKLLRSIEELYGLIFVDISPGRNSLSAELMEDADLVVINLNQNMGITEQLFRDYGEELPKKVFYLFGNYDNRSKFNMSNIRKKYYKSIHWNNSAVVPYNTKFRDSLVDGTVIDFIRCNLGCTDKDANFYFMSKAIKATEKILKYAGMKIEGV